MAMELTDSAVLLRLIHQAMRRAGLPAEEILQKAGVALSRIETHQRTPLYAQLSFWRAAQEVSQDPDIGLHLGEQLPLYRGQVMEPLHHGGFSPHSRTTNFNPTPGSVAM